jgi:hypothetical protein
MKAKIREEFFSGFCREQNQTRMVACEFEELEDGSIRLYSSDYSYGECTFTGDCLLMKEADFQ